MLIINKLTVFSNKTWTILICKRLRWSSNNTQLFCDLFDLTPDESVRYRNKVKLPSLDEKQIRATAALCESLNVSKEEWLKYPTLVKEFASTLEQRCLQLKEGGFINVDAGILAHYRKCIGKQISFLKAANLISKDVNVAERFVSYLTPNTLNFAIHDLTDEKTFEDIHYSILTRYLMWKCELSIDAIEKFHRLYSLSKVKSFEYLSENFAIAEELGFPPQRILKYGYLLTVNPNHTRRVLSEMPVIAGTDIREAMKVTAKLIGIPLEKYVEVYDYLKSEGISDESISKSMNVFTISLKLLKCRIQEVKAIPELRVLVNSPQFLKLIIHHNKARSRLCFLQRMKLKCTTTALLCKESNQFESYVRFGKDYNNISDILAVLKALLKTDNEKLKKDLEKHPFHLNIPLLEIEKSYNLLKKLRFTNKSIAGAIHIVLYPSKKIQNALKELKAIKGRSYRTISGVEKLNGAVYLIEKDHHFTGNGIWKNNLK